MRIPGYRVIGRLATLDSSRVTWPWKPGSRNPAVEWVSSPSRPNDDFPSSRAARSGGMPIISSVEPSTNSPGCRMRASSGLTSTSSVSPSMGSLTSMKGWRALWKTRKRLSRRTSMLDGCSACSSNGSTTSRPAAIASRRLRSERITTRLRGVRAGSPHSATPQPPTLAPLPQLKTAGYNRSPRGRSSMVELELPKLAVRVRFPSPALTRTAGHEPAASPPRDPLAGGQAADAADLKLRPSAFEAPASRAVRFRGGDPERGVEGEEVQLPRRRSGARGAERRGERVALHLGRPPTLAVQAGHPLQRRWIGDPGRLALQDQVDALQPDRERAGRVRRQVASLAGAGSAGEAEIAVEPCGADAGGVGAAVRPGRPEEVRGARLRLAGHEEVVRPAPRQRRGSVAVEVGHLDGLSVGHRSPPVRSTPVRGV